MKKIALFLALSLCAISANAQTTYTSDTTNTVYISYADNAASAVVCENIKDYVTITFSGAHVRVVQSSSVSATTGEITYDLSGSSADGSFYMEGSYKATVALRGVTLTNPSGAALDIQNGKRIEISIKRNTVNTLTDGTSTASDAWKGAIRCKGHLEFKGYGILNVYGKYANAIWSKEYTEVKNCTINVLSAVKDGINCNQYFAMESGEVNISGFGDDGISVGLKSGDTSSENTGNFTLSGGTIHISTYGASGKGVNAKGSQTVADTATLDITSEPLAIEDAEAVQQQGSKILQNGQLYILRGDKIYTIYGQNVNHK